MFSLHLFFLINKYLHALQSSPKVRVLVRVMGTFFMLVGIEPTTPDAENRTPTNCANRS